MTAPLTLSSLPLFPLGTVLFPDGELPLRIFEVRYLDMITRCQRAGAPFGVVVLQEGSEVRRAGAVPEVFADVGTLATVVELTQAQPGLVSVRCVGLQRFTVVRSSQLKHGLWIADVERLSPDTEVPLPDDLRATAQSLAKVLTKLQTRTGESPHGTPDTWQLDSCGWVANRWCELLPMPLELKQRMMQLDNPLIRLELVGDLLAETGIGGTTP